MIVVDASALIAILNEEDDAARYAKAIAEADAPLISAATLVEAGIVMLNRHGPKGALKVTALLQEAECQVENVTAHHAQLALDAYAMYGKDRKARRG